MLEIIEKIGLFTNQPILMTVIILIGFVAIDEKIYGKTLLILLFTMIYNVFLKSIWQIPLPAHMEGWAFPSGHMHSAVVFWGSLAIAYHRLWIWAVTILILSLGGYGLLHAMYHYPIDILGAFAFGSLSLFIFYLLQKNAYFAKAPYRLGVLLSGLAILVVMLMPENARKLHVWQALGGLIGFTLGWYYLNQYKALKLTISQSAINLFLVVAGCALLFFSIKTIPLLPSQKIAIQFFFIGLWINYSQITLRKRFSLST